MESREVRLSALKKKQSIEFHVPKASHAILGRLYGDNWAEEVVFATPHLESYARRTESSVGARYRAHDGSLIEN